VARLVIVVAFVAGVVWNADHEIKTVQSSTSNKIVAHWDVDAAYWSCLTAQVKSVVPAGRTVWASQVAPNAPSSVRSLWKATAGIRPLSIGKYGVIDLYLVSASKGHGCLGVKVKAVSPTGVVKDGKGTVPSIDWARWANSTSSP